MCLRSKDMYVQFPLHMVGSFINLQFFSFEGNATINCSCFGPKRKLSGQLTKL